MAYPVPSWKKLTLGAVFTSNGGRVITNHHHICGCSDQHMLHACQINPVGTKSNRRFYESTPNTDLLLHFDPSLALSLSPPLCLHYILNELDNTHRRLPKHLFFQKLQTFLLLHLHNLLLLLILLNLIQYLRLLKISDSDR